MADLQPNGKLKTCCDLPPLEYWVCNPKYGFKKTAFGICEYHARRSCDFRSYYDVFIDENEAIAKLLKLRIFGDNHDPRDHEM